MEIEIVKATMEHELLTKGLWELFLHDLSEFTDESWMGDDGEWQPPWGKWKQAPAAAPILIVRVDQRPAGFACVAFAPHIYMSPGRDIALAQFFILRGYRRRGIGRQFAHALFGMSPGKWEVGWMEQNATAKQFWNTVVAEYTSGNFIQAPVRHAPDAAPVPGLHFTAMECSPARPDPLGFLRRGVTR